ncbi:MAG: hypothetical protein ABFS12_06470 [Bacteroidota bacterium]
MTRVILVFLFISSIYSAQGNTENLIQVVSRGNDNIYIDTSGLDNFSGEDIFIWAVAEHSVPITIESIEKNISKTKTYYLFNKRLNKYSILFLIYYDDIGNVLASYDYNRNTNIEVYQYNYPIWENSTEYAILNKCIEIIDSKNQKE